MSDQRANAAALADSIRKTAEQAKTFAIAPGAILIHKNKLLDIADAIDGMWGLLPEEEAMERIGGRSYDYS